VNRWSRGTPAPLFYASVDSKGLAWAEKDPFPAGRKRALIGPPRITKGYHNGRNIKGNSKGQEKVGGGERGKVGRKCEENKQVAFVIRKLDKETLNLYAQVRAALGTREPSWMGLILNGLRPE
jgi:hypothetical protein